MEDWKGKVKILMIKMKKGSIIPKEIKLKEEYKIEDNTIFLNIDVNKILNLLQDFVKLQTEELFLFIEVPTNINKISSDEKFDCTDIYYLDGIKLNQIEELLNQYGEILVNDGLCEFGFGIRSFTEEIMCLKYNMIRIYSKENINKYTELLNQFNIIKSDNFKSAWDFFTEDNPGRSRMYEKDGDSIYTIIDSLKEFGLYLGERKKIN